MSNEQMREPIIWQEVETLYIVKVAGAVIDIGTKKRFAEALARQEYGYIETITRTLTFREE
jgi:hypothetical protein